MLCFDDPTSIDLYGDNYSNEFRKLRVKLKKCMSDENECASEEELK